MYNFNRVRKVAAAAAVIAAAGVGVFASAPAAMAAPPSATASSHDYLDYASLEITTPDLASIRNARVGDKIEFTFSIKNVGNQVFASLEWNRVAGADKQQSVLDDWPLYLGDTRQLVVKHTVTSADLTRGYVIYDLELHGNGILDDGTWFQTDKYHRAAAEITPDA